MPSPQDELLAQIRATIEQFGFYTMGVGAGDGFPTFSYTVGLQGSTGHPEIIIVGLPPRRAHAFFHQIHRQAKNGRIYQHGDMTRTLAQGYQSAFINVAPDWKADLMTFTTRFYGGRPFDALQFVFPDKNRVWPWMPEFEGHQPYSGTPPETLNDRDSA